MEASLNIRTRQVIPIDTKKIFSAPVSLKSMWRLWKKILISGSNSRLLEVWQFMLHVLSSSYNVSSPELWNEWKTQQWGLRVTSDIVLNQVRVYHERVFADTAVSKLWFVRSFTSQQHSNFVANNIPKMYPWSALKNARPDLPFAK